jgi:hypothetical protein
MIVIEIATAVTPLAGAGWLVRSQPAGDRRGFKSDGRIGRTAAVLLPIQDPVS